MVGFLSGAVFAVGLALSGMTDPGKVLAFLDVGGAWDPTLAFVMGGAVGTHALGSFLLRRRGPPSSAPKRSVDAQLIAGAALFGLGWGMSGYCPGPALVTAAYGRAEALELLASMVAGMLLFGAWKRSRVAAATADAAPLTAND